MRFSQRIGKKPVKTIFQVDDIDTDLRNRLWNIVFPVLERISFSYYGNFYKNLWKDFLVLKISDIPIDRYYIQNQIEQWFFNAQWYEIYDFVEYLISTGGFEFRDSFIDDCNEALRMEVSAYRIIDKTVVRINAEEEIQSIEEAIVATETYRSVNTHLKAALDYLSDRTAPDYRNSIKESISAVEALCRIITGDEKATLGKALTFLEKKHNLHGSLKTAMTTLYGYTSDAGCDLLPENWIVHN